MLVDAIRAIARYRKGARNNIRDRGEIPLNSACGRARLVYDAQEFG
jgi:hypothetical protein